MLNGKKIVVVMPAYNAERTLNQTVGEIDRTIIDDLILVDDSSRDQTPKLSLNLKIHTFVHDRNYGYGGNQKTCYTEALKLNPDIIIMLHPDYQYTPKLLVAMASMIASGLYDVVLASRILCGTALKGGMPLYKYFFNRCLTLAQNILMGTKLSEFHTGYRAYSANVLRQINFQANSDDFVFDNQVLAQIAAGGFNIGEVSCPTVYSDESSSINFKRSVIYGLGVLKTSVQYFMHRMGLFTAAYLNPSAPAKTLPTYFRPNDPTATKTV